MSYTTSDRISPYLLTYAQSIKTVFTTVLPVVALISTVVVAGPAAASQVSAATASVSGPFTGPPKQIVPPTDDRFLGAQSVRKPAAEKTAAAEDTAGAESRPAGPKNCGKASWYGYQGRTASGERFTGNELTAAHRSLPFGSRLQVTNMATHRTVTVRVNDRGPFVHGRLIDLSRAAAREIGMVSAGVAPVCVVALR